ncbi:hypothetical protein N7470_005919 [Penicillium chermesinum]|nr:hypothetical protein N7470_005919 [Penicillium chermesinum]
MVDAEVGDSVPPLLAGAVLSFLTIVAFGYTQRMFRSQHLVQPPGCRSHLALVIEHSWQDLCRETAYRGRSMEPAQRQALSDMLEMLTLITWD